MQTTLLSDDDMPFEEEYEDIFKSIEFVVIRHFRYHPDMTDYAALRTYEALAQSYTAESRGRPAKPPEAEGSEGELLRAVRTICEWRLGRESLSESEKNAISLYLDDEPIDVATIVLCLKRLAKSVKRWNKEGGQQGYLKFVARFF